MRLSGMIYPHICVLKDAAASQGRARAAERRQLGHCHCDGLFLHSSMHTGYCRRQGHVEALTVPNRQCRTQGLRKHLRETFRPHVLKPGGRYAEQSALCL